jgi:hypothetical protein
MPTLSTRPMRIATIGVVMVVATPGLFACQPPGVVPAITFHVESVTPYPIDGMCPSLNIVEKRRMVINNFNFNHLYRDITKTDPSGGNSSADAKFPIPHAPYNTYFDLDLRDALIKTGDAVRVRIVLRDSHFSFAKYPDQITAGDDVSRPMFCGLTATQFELGPGGRPIQYVEFYAIYGGGDPTYHIGSFNINLVAPDSADPTHYSLPFSIDPHVGNNG